ncbi:MAG: biotin/lipoyl-containing protein [Clostridiaceae bacterium]|nr:biotin/lipoyl-containing protein [Clostridiaceae bacterium]
MIYIVTINNKSYEVEVEKGQASLVKTETAVYAAPAALPQPPPAAQTAAMNSVPDDDPAAGGAGVRKIQSPMPGTILDIKAQPGSPVKKGDVLFILEAMKMENEIMASASGVAGRIYVAKGASVATGDLLMTINQEK